MRAYRDPTADAAIANVERQRRKNTEERVRRSGTIIYREAPRKGGKRIHINKAEWFQSRFNKEVNKMELKIEYLSPGELKPYENNAKRHPAEQIEQIKDSIQEFGFNDPIAIDSGNVIVEGHGRLIAAQ